MPTVPRHADVAAVRRGVWVFPSAPAGTTVDAIVAAEQAGIDEFWVGDEGPARDPFAILAAAAVRTRTIRLGIAVTNPYLRHPMTIATEAMTIDELSDGRMVLGLGPGGDMALGPAGVERRRPLATTREALRTICAVASGVATDAYTPPAHAFVRPLAVHIGSRSERFQRLASAEADGVFLGGLPEAVLDDVVAWARSERAIDVGIYSTGLAERDQREALRPRLIMPLADSPDHSLAALGLDRDVVRAAAAAYATGDSAAAEQVVTDAVFDQLVIAGTAAEVAARLAARVRRFHPTTIGLTFTSPDPLAVVDAAASAFHALDKELQ